MLKGTCTHAHVALVDFVDAILNDPPLERAAWLCMGRAEHWWGEYELMVWSACDGTEITTGYCCTVIEAERSAPDPWGEDKPAIFGGAA